MANISHYLDMVPSVFEDLSQSKIEALRKNNFTNEQFKESAKKQLAFYQTILQTKFHVLNKTLTKT